MIKKSYTDLKLILILTFLSVIFLFIPILNQGPQSLASYGFLLFFLPGYSLLAALRPSVTEMDVWKRILFGIVLGVILVTSIYLLWIYTPIMIYLNPLVNYLNFLGVYISPFEPYMSLAHILSTILILDLVIIAWARRRASPEIQEIKERYLSCERCKGYYKLEGCESPTDFESCQCGGKLTYTEKVEKVSEKQPSKEKEQEIEPIKQIKFYSVDLLLVFFINIICLAVLQQTSQPNYHTVVEFLLIFILPGYALISTLYPKKDDAGSVERLVYSFASSMVLTVLVGLALYFRHGVFLNSILYSLSCLTFVFLLAAYLRRRSTPENNRFSTGFGKFFKDTWKVFSSQNRTEKFLSSMVILLVVLLVSTTYITANPLEGKPSTDFNVLNLDGNAVSSLNMTSGESDNLTISIVNHENKKTTYRLLVTSGGVVQTDQTITLKNGEKTNINFNFTAGDPGTRDMEFNLYKLPDNDNIYKVIKIPLTVNEILEESEESTVSENSSV